jgi:hypothetical protein
MSERIDLTPRWQDLVLVMLESYKYGNEDTEQLVKEEFMRLAKGMDKIQKLFSDCRQNKSQAMISKNQISTEVMNAVEIVMDVLERYY